MLQVTSFVDDIGLVIQCDELEKGTRQLEHSAVDAMRWGSDNKVECEVSETKMLVFSRRPKVLLAARDTVVQIAEHTFVIKQRADQVARLLA
jgi:hypothetical protein